MYPLYRKTRPLKEGTELFLSPAQLSVPVAESIGIATVTNTLKALGSAYQILPEEEAPLSALRERNTIVVGTPMGSDVVSKLLRNTPLTIDYHPDAHFFAVLDQRTREAPKVLLAVHIGGPGELSTLYGLITVLPSEGAGRQAETNRDILWCGIARLARRNGVLLQRGKDEGPESPLPPRWLARIPVELPGSGQVHDQCASGSYQPSTSPTRYCRSSSAGEARGRELTLLHGTVHAP